MALLDQPGLTFRDMRAHFDGLDADGCWSEVERYGNCLLYTSDAADE